MKLHKNTKATPVIRQEIWDDYRSGIKDKTKLSQKYRLSRPTVYKILKEMRLHFLYPKSSVNHRFASLEYGLKRLAKIELSLLKKKNEEARRYSKRYPGELFHMDSKRLPPIKGDGDKSGEYLIVGIDHYSAEGYAILAEDKSQLSSAKAFDSICKGMSLQNRKSAYG